VGRTGAGGVTVSEEQLISKKGVRKCRKNFVVRERLRGMLYNDSILVKNSESFRKKNPLLPHDKIKMLVR